MLNAFRFLNTLISLQVTAAHSVDANEGASNSDYASSASDEEENEADSYWNLSEVPDVSPG